MKWPVKSIIIAAFYVWGILHGVSQARQEVTKDRLELLSGVKRSKDDKNFWDQKFSGNSYIFGKSPAKFLADNYFYIPAESTVLDVGMGEGRNAVFLARKGHKVTGVDISSVAIKKARALAMEFGVRINTVASSMDTYAPKEKFDAIICFYYVDRKLIPKMINWLKPGGILMFESHTEMQKTVKGHEHYNSEYLLKQGELLDLFKSLRIIKFEEPLQAQEYTSSIIVSKKKE